MIYCYEYKPYENKITVRETDIYGPTECDTLHYMRDRTLYMYTDEKSDDKVKLFCKLICESLDKDVETTCRLHEIAIRDYRIFNQFLSELVDKNNYKVEEIAE